MNRPENATLSPRPSCACDTDAIGWPLSVGETDPACPDHGWPEGSIGRAIHAMAEPERSRAYAYCHRFADLPAERARPALSRELAQAILGPRAPAL